MVAIIQPRYAEGTGEAPFHLSSVNRERLSKGAFIFSGQGAEGRKIVFTSNVEFLAIFRTLMAESVPLSIGGHCIGPADEVALLISSGELLGSYIEISWSGPEKWTLREIGKGHPPWERVDVQKLIPNTSFNPDTLNPDV
jgi:hypothetical protein